MHGQRIGSPCPCMRQFHPAPRARRRRRRHHRTRQSALRARLSVLLASWVVTCRVRASTAADADRAGVRCGRPRTVARCQQAKPIRRLPISGSRFHPHLLDKWTPADEAVTAERAPHRHRAGHTRRRVEPVAVQLHPATCPVCVTPSPALNSNLEQIAYMPGVVEAPIAPRETTAGRRGRMALEPPAHGDGEGEGYGSRPAEKKRVEIDGKGRAPAAGERERDGGWRRGQPTGRNRGRQRCHVAGPWPTCVRPAVACGFLSRLLSLREESDVGAARTREEIGGRGKGPSTFLRRPHV